MHPVKRWLTAILTAVQAVLFIVPFVLNFFGSHRMGAHRHLKVRADQYYSGILNHNNLTLAATVVTVVLVLLVCYLIMNRKSSPQRILSSPALIGIGLTIVLILCLVLPSARAILIFPWILLCISLIWLLQLVKLLTLVAFVPQVGHARRRRAEK